MEVLTQVIKLMEGQEKRLMKRIDEVHDDVKDTNKKITLQNGRLRDVEIKVAERETYCELRAISVDDKLDDMEPTIRVTRLIRIITKNPRLTTIAFFTLVIGTQSVVLAAIEKGWLGQLVNLIKP